MTRIIAQAEEMVPMATVLSSGCFLRDVGSQILITIVPRYETEISQYPPTVMEVFTIIRLKVVRSQP